MSIPGINFNEINAHIDSINSDLDKANEDLDKAKPISKLGKILGKKSDQEVALSFKVTIIQNGAVTLKDDITTLNQQIKDLKNIPDDQLRTINEYVYTAFNAANRLHNEDTDSSNKLGILALDKELKEIHDSLQSIRQAKKQQPREQIQQPRPLEQQERPTERVEQQQQLSQVQRTQQVKELEQQVSIHIDRVALSLPKIAQDFASLSAKGISSFNEIIPFSESLEGVRRELLAAGEILDSLGYIPDTKNDIVQSFHRWLGMFESLSNVINNVIREQTGRAEVGAPPTEAPPARKPIVRAKKTPVSLVRKKAAMDSAVMAKKVKQEFDAHISKVAASLSGINQGLENASSSDDVVLLKKQLEEVAKQLLKAQKALESLGYPTRPLGDLVQKFDDWSKSFEAANRRLKQVEKGVAAKEAGAREAAEKAKRELVPTPGPAKTATTAHATTDTRTQNVVMLMRTPDLFVQLPEDNRKEVFIQFLNLAQDFDKKGALFLDPALKVLWKHMKEKLGLESKKSRESDEVSSPSLKKLMYNEGKISEYIQTAPNEDLILIFNKMKEKWEEAAFLEGTKQIEVVEAEKGEAAYQQVDEQEEARFKQEQVRLKEQSAAQAVSADLTKCENDIRKLDSNLKKHTSLPDLKLLQSDCIAVREVLSKTQASEGFSKDTTSPIYLRHQRLSNALKEIEKRVNKRITNQELREQRITKQKEQRAASQAEARSKEEARLKEEARAETTKGAEIEEAEIAKIAKTIEAAKAPKTIEAAKALKRQAAEEEIEKAAKAIAAKKAEAKAAKAAAKAAKRAKAADSGYVPHGFKKSTLIKTATIFAAAVLLPPVGEERFLGGRVGGYMVPTYSTYEGLEYIDNPPSHPHIKAEYIAEDVFAYTRQYIAGAGNDSVITEQEWPGLGATTKKLEETTEELLHKPAPPSISSQDWPELETQERQEQPAGALSEAIPPLIPSAPTPISRREGVATEELSETPTPEQPAQTANVSSAFQTLIGSARKIRESFTSIFKKPVQLQMAPPPPITNASVLTEVPKSLEKETIVAVRPFSLGGIEEATNSSQEQLQSLNKNTSALVKRLPEKLYEQLHIAPESIEQFRNVTALEISPQEARRIGNTLQRFVEGTTRINFSEALTGKGRVTGEDTTDVVTQHVNTVVEALISLVRDFSRRESLLPEEMEILFNEMLEAYRDDLGMCQREFSNISNASSVGERGTSDEVVSEELMPQSENLISFLLVSFLSVAASKCLAKCLERKGKGLENEPLAAKQEVLKKAIIYSFRTDNDISQLLSDEAAGLRKDPEFLLALAQCDLEEDNVLRFILKRADISVINNKDFVENIIKGRHLSAVLFACNDVVLRLQAIGKNLEIIDDWNFMWEDMKKAINLIPDLPMPNDLKVLNDLPFMLKMIEKLGSHVLSILDFIGENVLKNETFQAAISKMITQESPLPPVELQPDSNFFKKYPEYSKILSAVAFTFRGEHPHRAQVMGLEVKEPPVSSKRPVEGEPAKLAQQKQALKQALIREDDSVIDDAQYISLLKDTQFLREIMRNKEVHYSRVLKWADISIFKDTDFMRNVILDEGFLAGEVAVHRLLTAKEDLNLIDDWDFMWRYIKSNLADLLTGSFIFTDPTFMLKVIEKLGPAVLPVLDRVPPAVLGDKNFQKALAEMIEKGQPASAFNLPENFLKKYPDYGKILKSVVLGPPRLQAPSVPEKLTTGKMEETQKLVQEKGLEVKGLAVVPPAPDKPKKDYTNEIARFQGDIAKQEGTIQGLKKDLTLLDDFDKQIKDVGQENTTLDAEQRELRRLRKAQQTGTPREQQLAQKLERFPGYGSEKKRLKEKEEALTTEQGKHIHKLKEQRRDVSLPSEEAVRNQLQQEIDAAKSLQEGAAQKRNNALKKAVSEGGYSNVLQQGRAAKDLSKDPELLLTIIGNTPADLSQILEHADISVFKNEDFINKGMSINEGFLVQAARRLLRTEGGLEVLAEWSEDLQDHFNSFIDSIFRDLHLNLPLMLNIIEKVDPSILYILKYVDANVLNDETFKKVVSAVVATRTAEFEFEFPRSFFEKYPAYRDIFNVTPEMLGEKPAALPKPEPLFVSEAPAAQRPEVPPAAADARRKIQEAQEAAQRRARPIIYLLEELASESQGQTKEDLESVARKGRFLISKEVEGKERDFLGHAYTFWNDLQDLVKDQNLLSSLRQRGFDGGYLCKSMIDSLHDITFGIAGLMDEARDLQHQLRQFNCDSWQEQNKMFERANNIVCEIQKKTPYISESFSQLLSGLSIIGDRLQEYDKIIRPLIQLKEINKHLLNHFKFLDSIDYLRNAVIEKIKTENVGGIIKENELEEILSPLDQMFHQLTEPIRERVTELLPIAAKLCRSLGLKINQSPNAKEYREGIQTFRKSVLLPDIRPVWKHDPNIYTQISDLGSDLADEEMMSSIWESFNDSLTKAAEERAAHIKTFARTPKKELLAPTPSSEAVPSIPVTPPLVETESSEKFGPPPEAPPLHLSTLSRVPATAPSSADALSTPVDHPHKETEGPKESAPSEEAFLPFPEAPPLDLDALLIAPLAPSAPNVPTVSKVSAQRPPKPVTDLLSALAARQPLKQVAAAQKQRPGPGVATPSYFQLLQKQVANFRQQTIKEDDDAWQVDSGGASDDPILKNLKAQFQKKDLIPQPSKEQQQEREGLSKPLSKPSDDEALTPKELRERLKIEQFKQEQMAKEMKKGMEERRKGVEGDSSDEEGDANFD